MLPGNALQIQGKAEEAVTRLRAAVAAAPPSGEAHYYLTGVLASRQQFPEAALQLAQQAPGIALANGNADVAATSLGRNWPVFSSASP